MVKESRVLFIGFALALASSFPCSFARSACLDSILTKMALRLEQSQGITLTTEIPPHLKGKTFSATFVSSDMKIVMNPDLQTVAGRVHAAFHETVHATTMNRLLKHYSPENAARFIFFEKRGGSLVLSDSLPEVYRNGFYNDEGIAYRKGALHAKWIERKYPADNNREIVAPEVQKKYSEEFKRVSKAILYQLMARMSEYPEQRLFNVELIGFTGEPFDIANFTFPVEDGGTLSVQIPIRHSDGVVTEIEVLRRAFPVISASRRLNEPN